MNDVPPPLEWHPFYRERPWLKDWLECRGELANHYDVKIAAITPVKFSLPADEVTELTQNVLTMARRRACGSAPYVGRPFHYEWYVGVDNLGRMIAGDSRIIYEPWQPWHPIRTADCDLPNCRREDA